MRDDVIKLALSSMITVVNEAIAEVSVPSELNDYVPKAEVAKKIVFGPYDPIIKRDNLQSIFNVLNGNSGDKHYLPISIGDDNKINFPTDEHQVCDYSSIAAKVNKAVADVNYSSAGLNRLLELFERELTYIPGTLNDPDISLFDQAKLAAAIASCIAGVQLSDDISSKDLFMLYSMDFSGIQDFIYTINSKGALKTLRARSFYLEILMEIIIDGLLDKLGLSRINLIYSGGGHCYLLIPNTEEVRQIVDEYNYHINDWLLNIYDISLYVGHGYAPCSGDKLRNIPQGSYVEIFREVSKSISSRKANRYTSSQILSVNSRVKDDYSRECKICRRVDKLNSENECSVCSSIKNFSNNILRDGFFGIVQQKDNGLPLPDSLSIVSSDNYDDLIRNEGDSIVRVYRKRQIEDGHDTIGIWVADYASESNTLEKMAADAKSAGRIERIGVLRADVDNLGAAFASGFDSNSAGGNIMRTAALSRQLSLFFKYHINMVLGDHCPNVTICYCGGDDLFIVGEWYDMLMSSLDIKKAFEKYTDRTLSISGGVGIYDSKYPISRIAYETAEMEDRSKHLDGKNAITLFENNTYHWDEFESKVCDEKLGTLSAYFDETQSHGNSFLYKLLELIRNQDERINFARYVYLLARLEPGKNADPEEKKRYKEFADKMSGWINSESDRRQLITAIQLYVYMTRNKED